MAQNYKSIKCYNISMAKVNWIRQQMEQLGYNSITKSHILELSIDLYSKMLLKKMKSEGKL
jgi:hypothetical protein